MSRKHLCLFFGCLLLAAVVHAQRQGERAWQARLGRRHEIPVINEVTALAVAPDGSIFAVATHNTIGIFSPETGKVTRPPLDLGARAMAFLDAQRLAVVTTDVVGVFDLTTGTVVQRLQSAAPVNTVLSYSPNGNVLAALGPDGIITVWRLDAADGRPIRIEGPPELSCLDVSDDGRWLGAADQRSLRLWNLDTGKPMRPLQSLGGGEAIAFSPDGRYLAANGKPDGQGFKQVTLWDLTEGKAWRNLMRGHVNEVVGVGYSYGGQVLASADRAGNVLLWNAVAGVGLTKIDTQRELTHLAIGANGRTLVTALYDAGLVVWQFEVSGIGDKTGTIAAGTGGGPVRSKLDDDLLGD